MMANRVPDRWMDCPRKSRELIANKFLAFKTPLNHKFDKVVPGPSRFTIEMLFSSIRTQKVKLSLWIDLTNTNRYYNKSELESYGCKYVKLHCCGSDGPPDQGQTRAFIKLVDQFISQNPLDVIGVHCTHGFNRTGYLIISYLVEKMDFDLNLAIETFAKCRPIGIYKKDYLRMLYKVYDKQENAPLSVHIPEWCFNGAVNKEKNESPIKDPKFMVDLAQVKAITDWEVVGQILYDVYRMLGWKRNGFPGCQPVSINQQNINLLKQIPYHVSWKADGTRYMMLIKKKDHVYFLDRNNNVFEVSDLYFPYYKKHDEHLVNTLLDGELVIDDENNVKITRYFIYDIICYNGMDISSRPFSPDRLGFIKSNIIKPRHECMSSGRINKTKEPISLRVKDFWPVSMLEKIFTSNLLRELNHELDGLILQPSAMGYKTDRCDQVLKWKPSNMNSVDFRLRILKEERQGMISTAVGYLFVVDCDQPFGKLNSIKDMKKYDNCIIECSFLNNEWTFMRQRIDKYSPNSFKTATAIKESISKPVSKDDLLNYIKANEIEVFKVPPTNHK